MRCPDDYHQLECHDDDDWGWLTSVASCIPVDNFLENNNCELINMSDDDFIINHSCG